MNYTEIQIKEMVMSILEDIGYKFFENIPFIIKKTNVDDSDKDYGINNPWVCIVSTKDNQFGGDDGVYSFTIDDDEPNTILLIDGSGGQVPNYFIEKDENGKHHKKIASRN